MHDESGIDKQELFDKNVLIQIANTAMPFGKYKGRMLVDLPENYLIWLSHQGFPAGKLGVLLASTLALKIEGLTPMLKPLRSQDKK